MVLDPGKRAGRVGSGLGQLQFDSIRIILTHIRPEIHSGSNTNPNILDYADQPGF